MADGGTLASGNNATLPDGFKFVTDDTGATGHAQGVKLLYSADGSAVFAQVDVNGVLVNVSNAFATQVTAAAILAALATPGASAVVKAPDAVAGGSDNIVAIGGVRKDTLATITPAVGDYAQALLGPYGEQWVSLATALAAASGDSVAIKPPTTQIKKSFNATTTQAGTDVWSPASGKKIRVTNLIIGTYGTVGARLILWFGANADTTFSEGTDETLFKGSFAPSATVKPGAVVTFTPPFEATTADYELHCTTDAGMSVDIVVVGYEE